MIGKFVGKFVDVKIVDVYLSLRGVLLRSTNGIAQQ
ncbi:MAG: hypothetical protein GPOALKHO_000884 [Sodalis sp.]|nr:MAG: hypothetical protein GPOALKHO_000884 [Sodalis sp.]